MTLQKCKKCGANIVFLYNAKTEKYVPVTYDKLKDWDKFPIKLHLQNPNYPMPKYNHKYHHPHIVECKNGSK